MYLRSFQRRDKMSIRLREELNGKGEVVSRLTYHLQVIDDNQ